MDDRDAMHREVIFREIDRRIVEERSYVDRRLEDTRLMSSDSFARLNDIVKEIDALVVQLKDQSAYFITRSEYGNLATRVERIESTLANYAGRLLMLGVGMGVIAALLPILITLME